MLNVLRSEFEDFMAACDLQDAHAVQRREMRRAFFSGAFIALQAIGEAGGAEAWRTLHAEATREIEAMIADELADC